MNSRAKSFLLYLCCALVVFSPVSNAGKIKKKTVKYQYVLMPEVALDELDASRVRAEIAFKDMTVTSKKIAISTTDSVCNLLNQKVGKKEAYRNHYYKIKYNDPKPLLVVKDANEQVIYAKRVPTRSTLEERFGRGCMSSQASLDKALAENNQVHQPKYFINKVRNEVTKRVEEEVKTLLLPELRTRKFKLFYVKGDSYEDLDEAFNLSKSAYDGLEKSLPNSDQRNKLEKSIDIWLTALKEVDLNDKKARINKKIAQRIHNNIAMNSLALDKLDQAIKHFQEILLIRAGNSFSWGGMSPEDDINTSQERQRRYDLSPKAASDLDNIHTRIKELKIISDNMPFTTKAASDYDSLAADLNAYKNRVTGERITQKVKALKTVSDENPFRMQVQHTAMQGYVLFLTGWGQKYDEFPVKISELTQLNQLQLSGNNVKSVPKEIGNLVNLKVLKLQKNKITEVSPEIGKLINLEKLDLSKNKLSTLPDEIANLKKLKKLVLKGNNFSKDEIKRIKSLLPKKCKVKS